MVISYSGISRTGLRNIFSLSSRFWRRVSLTPKCFSISYYHKTLSLDPVPYVRMQVISLIFNLLKDKPEQEQNLLRLLVNKLVRRLSLHPIEKY